MALFLVMSSYALFEFSIYHTAVYRRCRKLGTRQKRAFNFTGLFMKFLNEVIRKRALKIRSIWKDMENVHISWQMDYISLHTFHLYRCRIYVKIIDILVNLTRCDLWGVCSSRWASPGAAASMAAYGYEILSEVPSRLDYCICTISVARLLYRADIYFH